MVSAAFWTGQVAHVSCGATQDPQAGMVCHEPVCHRVPFDGGVLFACGRIAGTSRSPIWEQLLQLPDWG